MNNNFTVPTIIIYYIILYVYGVCKIFANLILIKLVVFNINNSVQDFVKVIHILLIPIGYYTSNLVLLDIS